MQDKGATYADNAVKRISKFIASIYEEAQRDIEMKTKSFWAKHKAKDKSMREKLDNDEITLAEYQRWMRGQVFQGKQWESKMKQVESVLAEANETALQIVNRERINVYAFNSNWQAYLIEKSAGVSFGFNLYDADAVARLLREDVELLPEKKLDIPKDKKWNAGNMNRQITQGIIQGESLESIAARLAKVTNTNLESMLTNARTMMTGAQNAGRQERMERAKEMGIKLKKVWLSTLDGHTRTDHRKLDGQKVDVDKHFRVGGYKIMYPGDRRAKPAMVYGCRCTMITEVEKYPTSKYTTRYDNVAKKPIKNLTYAEWVRSKS